MDWKMQNCYPGMIKTHTHTHAHTHTHLLEIKDVKDIIL